MTNNCALFEKSVFLQAMLKKGKFLILIVLTLSLFSSCDNYQRLLKSNNLDLKLERAKEYYNEGNYYKALPLFEELLSAYRGRPELEDIYYYYSYSHYGQGDYLIAAYNFKNFLSSFPTSKYAEDAQFMNAYSYYQLSPNPKLDQSNTLRAIDAFQLFINKYPGSAKVAEANELIAKMRRTMERKAFSGAMLYYDMEQYQAAAIAFENLLQDYPDTPESELVNLYIVKSYYDYARKSIESKQEERFRSAVEASKEFFNRYPESKFKKEVENINAAALQALNKSDIK